MAGNEDKFGGFRFGLDILAVILSISALIVSLQSNRLARQDYEAKVVVMSAGVRSWSFSPTVPGLFICVFTANIANLGGVEAAITDYWATAYFHNAEVSLRAGEGMSNPFAPGFEVLRFSVVSTETFRRHWDELPDNPELINRFRNSFPEVPMKLDAKRTTELVAVAWVEISADPNFPDRPAWETSFSTTPGAYPFEVDLTLKLSTGEEVQTSRSNCTYLK